MLYVVSTPIGNLGDITFRAVETLKAADVIACEDTRKTRILCAHYGIKAPLVSYYEYNKARRGEQLLALLREGKRVALVSDAGTPGISDPGFSLIKSALEAGVEVVSVPGPTALISALSLSGFPTHRFVFEGFLPVKNGPRLKRLKELAASKETVVVYEAPHRLLKTLEALQETLGSRPVAVVREVTKKFEEVLRGAPVTLREHFRVHPPRGEFVLIF